MSVNLSARFTKDTSIYDGLENIEDKIVANPLETTVAIVVLRPKFGKINWESGGAITPTMRVLSIEPVFGAGAERAKQLLAEAFHDRTGRDEDPSDPNLFDHLGDDDGED